MMMYLEIQSIAFRCKFCMHVSLNMREKVSLMHKYKYRGAPLSTVSLSKIPGIVQLKAVLNSIYKFLGIVRVLPFFSKNRPF